MKTFGENVRVVVLLLVILSKLWYTDKSEEISEIMDSFNALTPIVGYFTVGILWGVTNPFIKRAAASKTVVTATGNKSHFSTLRHFCTEPKIFVPFLVNQMGSLVFYYLLSKEPVSRTAPICNAITFTFTALTGYVFLKEEIRSPILLAIGSLLVVLGTYFCCLEQ